MNDLIDRKAAIDALRAMQTYKLFAGDDMRLIDQAGAQTELMLLPPAQLGTNLAEVGTDLISRAAVIDAVKRLSLGETDATRLAMRIGDYLERLPSVQPERLTDDDFETIRIHLSAIKGNLCNQHRWEEAEEYQRIIDRFMSFASAQSQTGKWEKLHWKAYRCSKCNKVSEYRTNFCPNCGEDMRGENE